MTIYEQVQRERLTARLVEDIYAPPISTTVLLVSTTRPTTPTGQCAITFNHGRPVLTPAFKKPRWLVTERPTKDRGS